MSNVEYPNAVPILTKNKDMRVYNQKEIEIILSECNSEPEIDQVQDYITTNRPYYSMALFNVLKRGVFFMRRYVKENN